MKGNLFGDQLEEIRDIPTKYGPHMDPSSNNQRECYGQNICVPPSQIQLLKPASLM